MSEFSDNLPPTVYHASFIDICVSSNRYPIWTPYIYISIDCTAPVKLVHKNFAS